MARPEHDYYPTPDWVVEVIRPRLPTAATVLDPACGEGELLRAFPFSKCIGIDIDPHRIESQSARSHAAELIQGDALAIDWPAADLVVMNPPFKDIMAFVRKAVAHRQPRSTVACLARLTFLESQERAQLHRDSPSDVYVLSSRPRFRPGKDGKMGTDSVGVAWFVWGPGRGGRWQVL